MLDTRSNLTSQLRQHEPNVEKHQRIGSETGEQPKSETPVEMMFIGGVATQRGMVKALENRLGLKVDVPVDCEYVCALGTPLLGLKRLESRN